jgi:Leucine-rich repeat (LRR) protein
MGAVRFERPRARQLSKRKSANGATAVCRVFEQLDGVQELILRGNALTELPATTWQLTSLQRLDLSDNQLSAVPPDIAQLQQLQVLCPNPTRTFAALLPANMLLSI